MWALVRQTVWFWKVLSVFWHRCDAHFSSFWDCLRFIISLMAYNEQINGQKQRKELNKSTNRLALYNFTYPKRNESHKYQKLHCSAERNAVAWGHAAYTEFNPTDWTDCLYDTIVMKQQCWKEKWHLTWNTTVQSRPSRWHHYHCIHLL